MSRQLPRSTYLAAGLTGVVALAALLGWGVIGGDDEEDKASGEESSQEAGDADPEQLPDLEEGFEAIPATELFATISQAQQDAKSWEVASVATQGDQEGGTAVQQLMYTDEGASFRIQMETNQEQVADGMIEGLYVGETFYLKGLNPKKWDETWYQVPNDDEVLASFESMLQGSAASSLESFGEPLSYEVIGIEDAEELDDDVVRTVHYRMEVDPAATMGGSGVTEQMLTLDIWVDAENRPVQVLSSIESAGETYTSALYYSDYGKDFELVEPDSNDVTERRPPAMRQQQGQQEQEQSPH